MIKLKVGKVPIEKMKSNELKRYLLQLWETDEEKHLHLTSKIINRIDDLKWAAKEKRQRKALDLKKNVGINESLDYTL